MAVELECDGLGGAGSSVFGGESDEAVCFFEVEVGVAPCVEVAGAAEGLSGDGACSFAGVVDQKHGQVEPSLQGAQVCQER